MAMNTPLHFVIPKGFEREVAALPDQVLGKDYPYWLDGAYNWVALSWLVLRQYREGLTISAAPKENAMNFAHVMSWRKLGARSGEFRISARADYPRLHNVDFEIVQNPSLKIGPGQAFLPYWPVPGLIPRDTNRVGLSTLAYAGFLGPLNLASGLSAASDRLSAYDFHVIEPHLWHDLSKIDALVAIRSFDTRPHNSKPASKLYSAWLAGIPLIGGYDSAFSAIAKPDVDYIRVKNEEELHTALDRLANDRAYYDSFVTNGRSRAAEVSQDAIAKIWIECIDNQISPAFEHWKSRQRVLRSKPMASLTDTLRNAASMTKRAMKAKL